MATTEPGRATDLAALRVQIDTLDLELLGLLNRRAEVAQTVGALKRAEGSPAFRPEREAAVIDGLKAVNAGPLPSASVAPIWREIMSACRALETPTRVAYLGPAGTFSELAGDRMARNGTARPSRRHRADQPRPALPGKLIALDSVA